MRKPILALLLLTVCLTAVALGQGTASRVTGTVVDEKGLVVPGAVVTLTATDDVGVAGIEYRLNLGAWQKYAVPLLLRTGDSIRFRAVDVNGNTEATHVLAA